MPGGVLDDAAEADAAEADEQSHAHVHDEVEHVLVHDEAGQENEHAHEHAHGLDALALRVHEHDCHGCCGSKPDRASAAEVRAVRERWLESAAREVEEAEEAPELQQQKQKQMSLIVRFLRQTWLTRRHW